MKTSPFLILAGDNGWFIYEADAPCEVATQEDHADECSFVLSDCLPNAESVIQSLESKGLLSGVPGSGLPGAGVGVVIGVGSHGCYAARVSVEGLPARQVRQGLSYRFEAVVPFAVEELVLDSHGEGDERLVVATRIEPLEVFVHALEDAGVQVVGIAPLVLLAVQAVGKEESGGAGVELMHTLADPAVLAGLEEPGMSEVTCRGGDVLAWRWMSGQSNETDGSATPCDRVGNTLRLAYATVCEVVEEDAALWINLQQGPLASRRKLERLRRPIGACLGGAALLLVALMVTMQVQTWRYQGTASEDDATTQTLYESAYPGEAIPVSMERRLETRLREQRGRQGLATPDAQLFAQDATLSILHDLLERVPQDLRLVITDLRINNDGRIDILGQVRSHSDADTLANALRLDGRFVVTPPSTENLPTQGVQFSLHLTLPQKPQMSDAGALLVDRASPHTGNAEDSLSRETNRGATP